ncbi:MAG: Type 1 glutamine amidotransferase-like domain-containing protein [Clostridia bacterium]|nr:Type 1 glutamine amidotransferase-like domain-containing protein [Clostridia bacterium]
MIALLSNGITSEALKNALSKYLAPLSSAAVVVTADNEYKERNYHVPRVVDELKEYGLSVDTFDLDKQDASELLKYDVVEFIGGNPYYLLNSIRVHNASALIKQLAEKKVLLGWSAGAIVFTPSIEIVDKITPEINIVALDDLKGLCLTNTHLIPHYNKFLKRFDKLEDICKAYEQEHSCSIVRLNDGDGIIIEDGIETIIKST